MPSMFLSNSILRNVISKATEPEKNTLVKLLTGEISNNYSYEKIQEEICECGGHDAVNFFRGQGTGYLDILDDVAKELEIEGLPSYYGDDGVSIPDIDEIGSLAIDKDEAIKIGINYAEDVEEKIILKILEVTYENMSPDEKRAFDDQVNEVASKFGENSSKILMGTAGIIALGNLGGFATYTFLTTAMSAISMGTLSFGAYTAATSLLSVFLGPIGWAGVGAATLYSYGSPEYDKLISIVAVIGVIRQRIKYEGVVCGHK